VIKVVCLPRPHHTGARKTVSARSTNPVSWRDGTPPSVASRGRREKPGAQQVLDVGSFPLCAAQCKRGGGRASISPAAASHMGGD